MGVYVTYIPNLLDVFDKALLSQSMFLSSCISSKVLGLYLRNCWDLSEKFSFQVPCHINCISISRGGIWVVDSLKIPQVILICTQVLDP